MFKKEYFRIFLISLIFSLSVLVSLPRIPVEVDNFWFTTKSYIGGYEFKSNTVNGEKTISISNYKLGLDIGGGNRVVFKMGTSDTALRDRLINIIKKRLESAGLNDYKVGLSQDELDTFYIDVPTEVSLDRVILLASGKGDFVFKKIKASEKWNSSDFSKFVMDQTLWEDSGVTEKDVFDMTSSTNNYGASILQMTFTEEGNKKFRELARENIGKPIGFYINGLPYPFSVSLISEAVASDIGNSISFSGGFQKQSAEDFILQKKLPFSESVTVVSTEEIKPLVDVNQALKYGIALFIGVIASVIFLSVRFGYSGLLHGLSMISSLVFFSALLKIFSLEIGLPSILGIFVIIYFMSEIGYTITYRLRKEKDVEKPLDFVLYHVLDKETYLLTTPLIVMFVIMMSLYSFLFGQSKQIALTVSIGILVTMYFYPFVYKSFIDVFGSNKK